MPPEIFFNLSNFFQLHHGPGVYSAHNGNEYQKQKIMFLGSRALPVRKADILTAIYEPIV
jgi:hypothetical protein